jgi:prepilin-type N-terminal cleavage/methylation domain-containing protein
MENHIEVEENKQDKGFTLVELLIVIVILGILATVTIFAVRGITDQGKASTCKADSKTLQTAYEAYSAQYGGSTIPTTANGGVVPTGATFALGADAETTIKNAGFIRAASSNWVLSDTGVLSIEDNDAVTAGVQSANGCTAAMI